MRSRIVILLLLFLSFGMAVPQNKNISNLKKNKEKTLKEVNEANRKLDKNRRSAKTSLNELNVIMADLRSQKDSIRRLNNEIGVTNRVQRELKDSLYLLQLDLNAKRRSYAKAVEGLYRNHSSYDELLFVFSAESLDQAYRRIRYLKEFSAWRKRQAGEIVADQERIERKRAQYEAIGLKKQVLLTQQQKEKKKLEQQERNKRTYIAGLKKQEKQLKQEIARKKKQAAELDRKLDKLIAEEERKAADRAKQSGQGKSTTPSGGYKMTKEELALSGSFEKNKGKLPMPLTGSYKIIARFGLQKHPELKYVQIENSGIELQTTPGTKAKAVFGGTVSRIFVTPGYNSTVILRHGNYLTIYSNLSRVSVKVGEKVTARQELGTIFSDSEDGNRTVLTFQLWKERTKLNPELWLNL